MKNLILGLTLTMVTATSFAGDTLNQTYINKTVEPYKSLVKKAISKLNSSLNKTGVSFSRDLEIARNLIAKKSIQKKYKAAIVITEDQYDGVVKMNLSQYEDFLESAKDICYNGSIKTALTVANLLSDNIWIYDEYSLDDIVIKGDSIVFRVMDEFSFSDQDASEEDREDFITEYSAGKCK